MDKIIGNYLLQLSFPWDSETLAYLATNMEMAEKIGRLAGSSFIISGCELNAAQTARTEGYVYLHKADGTGEVLRLAAGNVQENVHVVTVNIPVTAGEVSYERAYTRRHLEWGDGGTGEEQYAWSTFATLDSIANSVLKSRLDTLAGQVALIQGDPIGTIKMWPKTTPPENYLLCDGGAIPNDEQYAALRSIVGNNTPNLKGRFVVGYDPDDGNNDSNTNTNYTRIGNKGGERRHTLTVGEMPSHTHGYKKVSGAHISGGYLRGNTNDFGLEDAQTSASGSGQSHENRPPYYVLAYIIKAK